jgi:hypothetical protein
MKIKCPAGTFEVPDEFTLREMKTIKNVSGLLPGQIEEALEQGDTGIVTALVVVAANRSGKKLTEDMVLDWTLSDLEFLPDEDEEDEPAKKKKAEPDPS